jgi:hypothetical protein
MVAYKERWYDPLSEAFYEIYIPEVKASTSRCCIDPKGFVSSFIARLHIE